MMLYRELLIRQAKQQENYDTVIIDEYSPKANTAETAATEINTLSGLKLSSALPASCFACNWHK